MSRIKRIKGEGYVAPPKKLTRAMQIHELEASHLGNLIERGCKCPVCSGILFLTGKTAEFEAFRCYGCKSIIHRSNTNKLTVVRKPEVLGVLE